MADPTTRAAVKSPVVGHTPNDSACADSFADAQPRLFAIAYRMTGSVEDAEDVCQDAWLRYENATMSRSDTENPIETPEAYLVRTVTNLAIDKLRSAHHRRETYVGAFLPEPIVGVEANTAMCDDPQHAAELADSLTFAFLVMLDDLQPTERAVLLLHDVFGYSFDEVASSVGKTSASCRQIASRTRKRLDTERSQPCRPSTSTQRTLIDTMITHTANGDIDALIAMMAPDIVQLDDGGPHRRAARNPIVGPQRVARLIINLAKRLSASHSMEIVEVNGVLGILFLDQGEPDMVMTFDYNADNLVRRIFLQLNPEKLRHLT